MNDNVPSQSNTSAPTNENDVLDDRLNSHSDSALNSIKTSSSTDCDNKSYYNNISCEDRNIENNNERSNCDTLKSTSYIYNQSINNDNGNIRISPSKTVNLDNLSSNIKQHLTKEIWRIFERYIAVDADQPCPISKSTKEIVIAKLQTFHQSLDTNCFNDAQREAFDALQV